MRVEITKTMRITSALCAALICFLYAFICHVPSSLAVIVKTLDTTVWTNEFEPVKLTCQIESNSTDNLRIEWKKIRNGTSSYVYFDRKIVGDLENRAHLMKPATILIFSAIYEDEAEYRCEVAAFDDEKTFDVINIRLEIRVKPAVPQCSVPESVYRYRSVELRCLENESNPAPVYRWFRDNEELPLNSMRTKVNYIMNTKTGTLTFRYVNLNDTGEYHCLAKNDAGHAQCPAKRMEVYQYYFREIVLLVNIVMIVVLNTCLGYCEWIHLEEARKITIDQNGTMASTTAMQTRYKIEHISLRRWRQ
ncbi:junctional adhesion molecule 3B-like isoform X2 [Vanacampus margaritifer]